jgi:amino acid transporter
VIFLYLGANVAYHLVIPQQEMAIPTNSTVVADFARRLLGPVGVMLASGAVMCSVFGALNGNLLCGPRVLYAMGEDGLAPRAVGAIHPLFRTPALAIAVLAGWSIFMLLAVALTTRDESMFDTLTDFAMFGAVIFETMAVTTIFVFRRRWPDAARPYRCVGYPIVPLLYLVLPAFILGSMLASMFLDEKKEPLVGLGFIAVGAVVYYGMGLQRNKKALGDT